MSWVGNLKDWRDDMPLSEEYFKNRYGDPAQYLADKTDFVDAADFYAPFGYGECYGGNDKANMCEILTIYGNNIDPRLMTYEQRMAMHIKEFCYKTSAHGIPMIGRAESNIYRSMWILLYITCMSVFFYNAVNVIDKYNRNEKIVDIQLKFETAAFPAITICNLNPYKRSAAEKVPLVARTLTAFYGALDTAGAENKEKKLAKDATEQHLRVKRSGPLKFEAAFSECDCQEEDDVMDSCDDRKRDTPADVEKPTCMCAFDRVSEDAFPCKPLSFWIKDMCATCSKEGHCMKIAADNPDAERDTPCSCTMNDRFCIPRNDHISPIKLWEYFGAGPPTEDPNFLEALGFGGMTDEIAIVTKAKENIMFAMSSLSHKDRKKMSYRKEEFVIKCSFNGKACDIDNDFYDQLDPTFGACFTFNHNRTRNLTSIRAGPNYGLRMLLYVAVHDYMPTTEATGVRMTIHEKEQYPFPDAFGYSAPTGTISSFGIRLKKMSRLPAPYGDCIEDGKTSTFIYEEYEYSTEGCYRSCFQALVLQDCNCGDPRFPVRGGEKHCETDNPTTRRCLDDRTKQLGGSAGSFRCRCQQPCNQAVFSVTYSAARWPSPELKVQLGDCNKTEEECVKHYTDNAAMVEVFYEVLNFEMLRESEAYGLVNVLADFGGQLGLWLGISFLTCFEFASLIVEMAYMSGMHHWEEYKKRKAKKKKREF